MADTSVLEVYMARKPTPEKPERKHDAVTVKIRGKVHTLAKKISAYTGERIEDILSDVLEEPLAKRLRKLVADDALPD